MKKIIAILFSVFVLISAITGISILRNQNSHAETLQLLEKGNEKCDAGDYEGAIKEYTRAIKVNPEYAAAYAGRSYALKMLKKYKEALKDCNSALWNLSKTSSIARFWAFFVRFKNKELWEKSLEAAADIEKSMSFEYALRGEVKGRLKDVKGAMKDFEKSIKCDKSYSRSYFLRADLELERGNLKSALDDLDKAIMLDKNMSFYYVLRGEVKRGLEDNEGALQDMDEALKIMPEPMTYNNRADLKNTMGDYSGALKDVNESLKLENRDGIPYCTRAEIKINMKDYTGAAKDFKTAIELAGDNEALKKAIADGLKQAEEKMKGK